VLGARTHTPSSVQQLSWTESTDAVFAGIPELAPAGEICEEVRMELARTPKPRHTDGENSVVHAFLSQVLRAIAGAAQKRQLSVCKPFHE